MENTTNTLPIPSFTNYDLDKYQNIVFGNKDLAHPLVCIRPGNTTLVPKVFYQKFDDAHVFNNYGHMGIGWTLGWGSAGISVSQFEEKFPTFDKSKEEITILGAGTVGLSTAVLLYSKGYRNIKIIAEKLHDTTSYKAGAIFSTASLLAKLEPTRQELLDKINKLSCEAYIDILKGKHAFENIYKSISFKDIYFGAEKEVGAIYTHSGLDDLVKEKLLPEPELVTLNFNGAKNKFLKYKGIYINPPGAMKEFYEMMKKYGISITKRKVYALGELSGIVFNCTGLSSNYLNNDSDAIPIAGHLVLLKKQNLPDYIIYTHYIHPEQKGKVKYEDSRLFYYMPRTDGLGRFGGTLMENYQGGNKGINNREYREIMKVAHSIFGKERDKPRAKF